MKYSLNSASTTDGSSADTRAADRRISIPVNVTSDSQTAGKVDVQSKLNLKPEHQARLVFYSQLATSALPTNRIRRDRASDIAEFVSEDDDELFKVSMDDIDEGHQKTPNYEARSNRITTFAVRLKTRMAALRDRFTREGASTGSAGMGQTVHVTPRFSFRDLDARMARLRSQSSHGLLMRAMYPSKRMLITVLVLLLFVTIIGLGYRFLVQPIMSNRSQNAAQSEQWNSAWQQWQCTLQEYKNGNNKETTCVSE